MDDAPEPRAFTTTDGTELSYIDEGEGPAVVLLHGLMANSYANWVEPGVFGAIVSAGYRAVAVDTRGHGHSAGPEDPEVYRAEVLAGDVAAIVRRLELEPVSLVGYSYGSVTSAMLAAAGDIKLTSLALCGVAMTSVTPVASGPEIDALVAALAMDDPESLGDEGLTASRKRMAEWNARPHAVASVYAALRELPPIDLAAIAVPVVVINSPAEPDDVASQVPGARTVIVKGDHLTAPLDPAFTEAVVTFLKETNPLP